MGIQFIDLKAQFAEMEQDIRAAMDRVLAHGRFIMGPEVAELEKKLAGFCGVDHCVSCSNGTDALLMPLMALDVGPGDAVLTTPFTFIATAEVISLLGATPVFVDVDPRTFNMDPVALDQTLADMGGAASGSPLPKGARGLHPRGVITVDLFGQPADYEAINEVAARHGLFVMEDAAQSLGATYQGRPVGNHGLCAATSFFPAKPLGCYGDGGAVLTNDGDLADTLRSIRVHGKGSHKYDNARIGLNARLDTLQAAVLLAKLPHLPAELEARQRAAETYGRLLDDVKYVTAPDLAPGRTSAWAQYSVLSELRQGIMDFLKQRGVPTAVYYPLPLHLQGAFADLGYRKGQFPIAERCAEIIFSLPMHPYLDQATQEIVVRAIGDAVAKLT